LVIACALLAGCSRRPEQPVLERFFDASRNADRASLASLATVSFDPRADGVVSRFEIVSVTPEEKVGDKITKNVTLTAPVMLPDGRVVDKKLAIAMERRGDRWMVTGLVAIPIQK
jgi:hypothetical protein